MKRRPSLSGCTDELVQAVCLGRGLAAPLAGLPVTLAQLLRLQLGAGPELPLRVGVEVNAGPWLADGQAEEPDLQPGLLHQRQVEEQAREGERGGLVPPGHLLPVQPVGLGEHRLALEVQVLAEQLALAADGIGVEPRGAAEEAEHALHEQPRGGLVVVGQAGVGEQVLVARVEEQLRGIGHLDQLTGGVEVALRDEQLVGVHRMDLDRGVVRPGAPELGDRDTGMKQQGALRARPGLGQHLRGQHPEREPGVDDLVRQALGGGPAALDDRVESDLPGVGDAVRQGAEGLALVEVGHGHPVAGAAELVCELADPVGEALRVMEHDDVGHWSSLVCGSGAVCR